MIEDRTLLRSQCSSETSSPFAPCHSRGRWLWEDVISWWLVLFFRGVWGGGFGSRKLGIPCRLVLPQELLKWTLAHLRFYIPLCTWLKGVNFSSLSVHNCCSTYLIYPPCNDRNYFLKMWRPDHVENTLLSKRKNFQRHPHIIFFKKTIALVTKYFDLHFHIFLSYWYSVY